LEDVAKPKSPFLVSSETSQTSAAGARPIEAKSERSASAWKIILLAIALLFIAGILIGLLFDLKPLANKYFGVFFNAPR